MKCKLNEFKQFLTKRVVIPLLNFLKEGVTPRQLALAVTLGLLFGIFPIIGVTTILCGAAALLFRLNMAAIQLVNYLIYPVQLLLFAPYLKIGAFIFNYQHILSIPKMSELTTFGDILVNLQDLYLVFLGAILVWLIFALAIGFIIFRVLYDYFRRKAILEKYNTL
jgi:uncharacterized protein (DUF2062 family)